jgi:hypothetical protein
MEGGDASKWGGRDGGSDTVDEAYFNIVMMTLNRSLLTLTLIGLF